MQMIRGKRRWAARRTLTAIRERRGIMKTFLSGLAWSLLLALVACGGGGGSPVGMLEVTIGGLPPGAAAEVTVSGPNDFQRSLSAGTTLSGLTLGSYSVTASEVAVDTTTYTAAVSGSPANVAADQTAQVTVTYSSSGPSGGAISGTLIYPGALGADAATGTSATDTPAIASTLRNHLHANEPVRVVPGEVFVSFKAEVRAQDLRALSAAGIALEQVRSLGTSTTRLRLYRAAGLDEAETLAVVDALRARDDVQEAFPNWLLYGFKQPNDALYGAQWHYPALNLEAAWDIEDGSSHPVTVAVVDSGSIPHPDLQANLLPGFDFISDPASAEDGDGRDPDPTDEGGDAGYHGAHVAGTIAAVTNNAEGVAGVSWGAKVVPVRALGTALTGTAEDILDGIVWAAGGSVDGAPANANPANVINLSLGANIGQACPNELNTFFQSLANEGVVVIAAAGNDNIDATTTFPANCNGVIAVGATGPQGERAPYSNYGSVIDVMAPGGDLSQTLEFQGETFVAGVLSTVKLDGGDFGYAFYQGTSMAAPHVSGLVALMLAKEPGLGVDELLLRLQNAATPLPASACKRPSESDCGAGLVDAAKALGGEGGGPPPPPATGNTTTYVAALLCTNALCSAFDLARSQLTVVEATSLQVPYTAAGLEPGTYVAAAWQDLSGNEMIDEGEPFGVHPAPISVQAGQQVTGIDIRLEAFSLASAAEVDPAQLKLPLSGLSRGVERAR